MRARYVCLYEGDVRENALTEDRVQLLRNQRTSPRRPPWQRASYKYVTGEDSDPEILQLDEQVGRMVDGIIEEIPPTPEPETEEDDEDAEGEEGQEG